MCDFVKHPVDKEEERERRGETKREGGLKVEAKALVDAARSGGRKQPAGNS